MASTKELSVYLVDDDPIFLATLEHQLERQFKVNISKFSTGEECLKNLNNSPSIVVLDYFLNSSSLDAMNGIRILEKIKQDSPETNVIILSSQDKMSVATTAMKSGALDYIIKNENAFLRVHNAVKNAIDRISLANEFKSDRNRIILFIAFIVMTAALVLIINRWFAF